jgi:hypothetical protein
MDAEKVRDAVLEAVEVSLEAQLRAVRKLRKGEHDTPEQPRKSMSQIDMAHDILMRAGGPLHIKSLLEQIRERYGLEVDRESLVSAIAKRVARGDRFERTEPNTFAARKPKAS